MTGILELAIVGAVVSLLVQGVKKLVGTNKYYTLAAVIGLSLVAGAIYYFAKDTAFWAQALQVLVYAGAVYTFLVKRFK